MAELSETAPQASARKIAKDVWPGLVWAFRIHADGSPEQLSIDEPIEIRHDGWLWLHFNLADARTPGFLSGLEPFPPAVTAALVAPDGHQQLQVEDSCVYGIFADLICDLGGATQEIGFLHFAMNDRMLVSARRHALNAVESARQALLAGCKLNSVAALLEMIIDHLIQSIDRYADEIAAAMDAVEEELLAREVTDQRSRLASIRKAAVRLHRQLQALRSLFQRVGAQLDREARPHLRLPAATLLQKLDGLDHEIVAMRDRAHLLQEEVSLKVAEETNRSLHLLTIITTVFLPANLVAGIFGMNTKGLPFSDDETGFVWAMIILIVSSALIFLLMRNMRVLSRDVAVAPKRRKVPSSS